MYRSSEGLQGSVASHVSFLQDAVVLPMSPSRNEAPPRHLVPYQDTWPSCFTQLNFNEERAGSLVHQLAYLGRMVSPVSMHCNGALASRNSNKAELALQQRSNTGILARYEVLSEVVLNQYTQIKGECRGTYETRSSARSFRRLVLGRSHFVT